MEWYFLFYSRYSIAAEQGDARAQNALGNCLYRGHGVTQNYNEACKPLDHV